jgi:hypothetical protein
MLLAACLGLVACGDSSTPDRAAATVEPARKDRSDAGVARRDPPAGDAASARLANAVATSKGGAAVDLLYDVALRPVALQPVEVELVFEPRAAADALEIEVSAVPGLTVVNAGQARFAPIVSGERQSTRVLVAADADGLYYVNVIARMVSKVQTDARTFSVPLVVGDASPAAPASGKPASEAPAPGAEAVKSVPAEEGPAAH